MSTKASIILIQARNKDFVEGEAIKSKVEIFLSENGSTEKAAAKQTCLTQTYYTLASGAKPLGTEGHCILEANSFNLATSNF